MKSRFYLIGLFVFIWIILSGCNSNLLPASTPLNPKGDVVNKTAVPVSTETMGSNIPQAFFDFRVLVPDDTPSTDQIYLVLLDEVTGLYLNSQSYPMVLDETTGIYSVKLPFPVNSVIKYRYERQGDELRTAEHTADGQPVRYRMAAIDGPGSVDDVVSRWTDSEFSWPSGRIMGEATDAVTGNPIPNLLVTAGGAQTYTASDGSFLIESLPPGIHNLVGYSPDGSYRVFQQGAEIAPDSTTPAALSLTPSKLVNITFDVKVPTNTPPVVPVRLAGNLDQLGNTFGTLTGGVSTLATRMPVLSPQSDGSYKITLQLPAGADIRYKYTLGDGYWNAEHTADGSFQLRQLIVPDQDTMITDTVETWETNPGKTVTFDVTVPANTPPEDYISIQFNPLFGWTEPVPMWNLGNNRWAYVLYSPMNLPGNLSYRYCRNNQCGAADDAATPGLYGAGRTVDLNQLPQQIKESVEAWVDLSQNIDPAAVPTIVATPRLPEFTSGIEFQPTYHPSWQPLMQQSSQQVKNLGANWQYIDPTWSFTSVNPPILQPVAGQDAMWPDLIDTIQKAHDQGLKVALNPQPNFSSNEAASCDTEPCPTAKDLWWQAGARDFSWWLEWFVHYRTFLMNYADLAAQTGAEALVVGGDWLNPALPNGVLFDGQPSGVPADAEQRWRSLLAEVRQKYSGSIVWALSDKDVQAPPPFLDAVDRVLVEWSIDPAASDTPAVPTTELATQFGGLMDGKIKGLQTATAKPIIIALNAPSNPGLDYQMNTYQAMLDVINQRDWISGFISSGYYPAARIQDQSASIHGKSAEILLQNWLTGIAGQQP